MIKIDTLKTITEADLRTMLKTNECFSMERLGEWISAQPFLNSIEIRNSPYIDTPQISIETSIKPDALGKIMTKYDNTIKTSAQYRNMKARNLIKDVKFSGPATIVWFYDTPAFPDDKLVTKVVVKCQPGDKYDREKGVLAAIAKYFMGGPVYNDALKKWCANED